MQESASRDKDTLTQLRESRDAALSVLNKRELLLEETGSMAMVGGWEYELETNALSWTNQTYAIHEVPSDFIPTIDTALDFYVSEDRPVIEEAVRRGMTDGTGWDLNLRIRTAKGRRRHVRAIGKAVTVAGTVRVLRGTFQDITELARTEEALNVALNLNSFAQDAGPDEILQYTVERAIDLTGSEIGFFHFISEDQRTIHLHTWSADTYSACAMDPVTLRRDYPLKQAGVWADSLRHGKPIVHNDYPSLRHKKGLPKGHVAISREIVVPVVEHGKVRALLGVGNREWEYDDLDVRQLSLIAEHVWGLWRRKKAEDELADHHRTLEQLVVRRTKELTETNRQLREEMSAREIAEERVRQGWLEREILTATLDNTPLALAFFKVKLDNIAILYWNETARRIFGWSKEEVLGKNFFEFLPAEDAIMDVREIFENLVRDRDPHNITHPCNTKAGGVKMIQWFNSSFIAEDGGTVYVVSLGQDVTKQQEMEQEMEHRLMHLQASSEVGAILTKESVENRMLQGCAEVLVKRYGGAFARIWTYDGEAKVLVLRASAGLYTHLEGDHSRIRLGEKKIGRVAETRTPIITNDVASDPRITDKAWASREKITSFVGFPLLVAGRLLGVVGMFSKEVFSPTLQDGLQSIATEIALGIERLRSEQARLHWGNELEARVEARTKELVRANELLQLEIEQRKRTEDALREAKAVAEEANEAKSRFLAGMSHELRTPLNGIIGFSDILLNGTEEDLHRDGEKYLGHINQSGKHLLALINDLLDLAKIEAGKLQITRETLRADELVDSVLQMISGRLIEKELHTDTSIHPTVSVRADRRLLRQVLLNLLSNAAKYSPAGETISIRVSSESEDMVRFHVCDRGPGVSEEHKERIFSEFYQVDHARDTELGGTGLGLALCRQLVTEHGGRIGVEDREGGGSVFWFTIPAGQDSTATTDSDKAVREAMETPSEISVAKMAENKRKILVAEDNPVNRELITAFMTTIGYDFIIAEDGQQAVTLAEEYRPDLILMDIMMPVMDGFEATRKLRADPETAEVPIIALTAAVDKKARTEALEAGCNLHLPKPINLKTLKEAIQALLAD